MREEEQSGVTGISTRDIAAAWACCGLVMLGALMADLGHPRDNSATVAYAGARTPGGAVLSVREPQADYDQDDKPAGEIGLFANDAAPVAINSVEASAKTETTGRPKLASRYCRYILRQSGIRYSAAARLVAAVGSGVREAAQ